MRLSIDPGAEYLLPFAKKKLLDLKRLGLSHKVIAVQSGERITIQSGDIDSIRIEGRSDADVAITTLLNWDVRVGFGKFVGGELRFVSTTSSASIPLPDKVLALPALVAGPQNDLAHVALQTAPGMGVSAAKVVGSSWEPAYVGPVYSIRPENDEATCFIGSSPDLGKCKLSHMLGELGRLQFPQSVVETVASSGVAFPLSISYSIGDTSDTVAAEISVETANTLLAGDVAIVSEGLTDRTYTKGTGTITVKAIAVRMFIRAGLLYVNAIASISPLLYDVVDLSSQITDFRTYLYNAALNEVGGPYDIPATESGEILIGTSIGLDGNTYYEYESHGTERIWSSAIAGGALLYRQVPGAFLGRALARVQASAQSKSLGPEVYVTDTGGLFTTSHRYYRYAVWNPPVSKDYLLYFDNATENIAAWPTYRIGQNVVAREPSAGGFTERVVFPSFELEVDSPSGGMNALFEGTIPRGTVGATPGGSGQYIAWSRDRIFDSEVAYPGAKMCTFRAIGFTDYGDVFCCALLPLWWDSVTIRKVFDSDIPVATVYAEVLAKLDLFIAVNPSDASAAAAREALTTYREQLDAEQRATTREGLTEFLGSLGAGHTTYTARVRCDPALPLFLGEGDFVAVNTNLYPYS